MSASAYGHLRALIVEDNVHMRSLLRSLLHSLGIRQVFESDDGAKGFEVLCERQPDMVLTDLSMAPVDGIAFTRRVRNDDASPNQYVPILMVTGHTERQRVEQARDAGVTEFLAKPIAVQNLMVHLAEIVEHPRPFVRCGTFFGPDRRRRRADNYAGPWRRHDDIQNDMEIR